MIMPLKIGLRARDVTGQKAVKIDGVRRETSVLELVEDLVPRMNLSPNDTNGRPLTYHARLEREGRHLHASEIIGEVLQEDDELVLQPNIDAGGLQSHG